MVDITFFFFHDWIPVLKKEEIYGIVTYAKHLVAREKSKKKASGNSTSRIAHIYIDSHQALS